MKVALIILERAKSLGSCWRWILPIYPIWRGKKNDNLYSINFDEILTYKKVKVSHRNSTSKFLTNGHGISKSGVSIVAWLDGW
jgi:hypothetical protein